MWSMSGRRRRLGCRRGGFDCPHLPRGPDSDRRRPHSSSCRSKLDSAINPAPSDDRQTSPKMAHQTVHSPKLPQLGDDARCNCATCTRRKSSRFGLLRQQNCVTTSRVWHQPSKCCRSPMNDGVVSDWSVRGTASWSAKRRADVTARSGNALFDGWLATRQPI
jgi:hypothetical protein